MTILVGDYVKFRLASNTLWGEVTFVDGEYIETELANQPLCPANIDDPNTRMVPIPGLDIGDQHIVRRDDLLDHKKPEEFDD